MDPNLLRSLHVNSNLQSLFFQIQLLIYFEMRAQENQLFRDAYTEKVEQLDFKKTEISRLLFLKFGSQQIYLQHGYILDQYIDYFRKFKIKRIVKNGSFSIS